MKWEAEAEDDEQKVSGLPLNNAPLDGCLM